MIAEAAGEGPPSRAPLPSARNVDIDGARALRPRPSVHQPVHVAAKLATPNDREDDSPRPRLVLVY